MPHATTTFNFTHFLPHDLFSFTRYLPLFLFDICYLMPYACEFCKRSEDLKGLKILLLKRYHSCILWSFLNMTQLEFYKKIHSKCKNIIVLG